MRLGQIKKFAGTHKKALWWGAGIVGGGILLYAVQPSAKTLWWSAGIAGAGGLLYVALRPTARTKALRFARTHKKQLLIAGGIVGGALLVWGGLALLTSKPSAATGKPKLGPGKPVDFSTRNEAALDAVINAIATDPATGEGYKKQIADELKYFGLFSQASRLRSAAEVAADAASFQALLQQNPNLLQQAFQQGLGV